MKVGSALFVLIAAVTVLAQANFGDRCSENGKR